MYVTIVTFRFNYLRSVAEFLKTVLSSFSRSRPGRSLGDEPPSVTRPLPDLVDESLSSFAGRVLLILSGNDLVAREFEGAMKSSAPWQKLISEGRLTRHDLKGADHTLSRREWREQVAHWTGEWMRTW
jgi:hypothetical protein